MQHERGVIEKNNLNGNDDCPFCQTGNIRHVLKETPHFLIAADHAPLVEGHLLIIPRLHYTCYGDAPADLDEELHSHKQEVRDFFKAYYHTPVFWEHGVFRQTVYHAHLHCFPFGKTNYDLSDGLHEQLVTSQDDIRAWYASLGHYFYLEDEHVALLFPPDLDRYLRVLKDVLWHGTVARSGQTQWRSAQQRQAESGPLIVSLFVKWQAFQQLNKRR